MEASVFQADAFLSGEGDHWYKRFLHGRPFNPNPDLFETNLVALCQELLDVNEHTLVVEVGSSRGDRLRRITQGLGCEGVGIDPSALSVAEGKQLWQGSPDLRVGTAQDTGLGDHSASVVFFGWCLMYVEPAAISDVRNELNRIIARGGLVAVLDFDYRSDEERLYSHDPDLRTYRRNYDSWLDGDRYRLVAKYPLEFVHGPRAFRIGVPEDPYDRMAFWLYRLTA